MIRTSRLEIRPSSEAVSSSSSPKSSCSRVFNSSTIGRPDGAPWWISTQRSSSHTMRSGSTISAQALHGSPPSSPKRGASSAGGRSAFGATCPSIASHGKTSQVVVVGDGSRPSVPAATTLA